MPRHNFYVPKRLWPFNSPLISLDKRPQLKGGQSHLIEFPEVAINLSLKFLVQFPPARQALFPENSIKPTPANTLIIIEKALLIDLLAGGLAI